jgi:hypothetical protein
VAYEPTPQRLLVVGWSTLGAAILRELDQFLAPGSSVDLLVDPALVDPCEPVPALPDTRHASFDLRASAEGPEELLGRDVADYDQVIVVGYRDVVSVGEADARTLLTLLTLEKAVGAGTRTPRVVAEVLDRTNVDVAQTGRVDDVIISDELSSLMIAQVSERMERHRVFDELFDAGGTFASLRPAPHYVDGAPTTFAAIVAAASRRGESALGWRTGADGAVVVNPPKSAEVALGPDDQVLVLGPR